MNFNNALQKPTRKAAKKQTKKSNSEQLYDIEEHGMLFIYRSKEFASEILNQYKVSCGVPGQ